VNKIIAYIMRNLSELVNCVEAALRLAGSIASLTPTPKDDSVVAKIKEIFKKIKELFA